VSASLEKPSLLVIGAVGQDLRDGLGKDHILIDHVLEGPQARSVATIPPGHNAVLTRALYGVPREVMDAIPGLKLIVSLGVGLDRIDLAEAARRGIAVAHTPDELTEDVAEYAIGLLYAAQRKIVLADQWVRQGKWAQGAMPLSRRVCDKKIGIVGLGKIGRRIAAKAAALGMEVHYQGRHPQSDAPYQFHAGAEALAAAVDVLVLSCPGTPETHHLANAAVLQALGPAGLLINISRGSVVDEDALLTALEQHSIGGAALDVFATEPSPNPRFLTLDNVVLAPHAASLTYETRAALIDRLVRSANAFFRGQPFSDAAAGAR